jgi:electron transfer flavoprotein beta subunit
MNIIVCLKQVIDPEAPLASFKIDAEGSKVIPPGGIAPVLDPYSEYALEAALRIKDSQHSHITAFTLGSDLVMDVVKKPLAMGADDLVLLDDEAFADGDSWSTAVALAAAIKKIGQYDLILCGRQAADWDNGQVGSGIAEILELPVVTVVQNITTDSDKLTVERTTDDGHEVIEVALPAVLTIGNGIGEVRYPNIKGIMAAKRKQPSIWKPADIGLDIANVGAAGRQLKLIKLFQPLRESRCQLITADTPEEAAVNLALKMRGEKLF